MQMKLSHFRIALTVSFDWLETKQLPGAGWRFATTMPGEQYATVDGEMMKVVLLVTNLVFKPMVT